ncbi:MAG: tyrosine recombinase [Oscillospiraceae bacterium]
MNDILERYAKHLKQNVHSKNTLDSYLRDVRQFLCYLEEETTLVFSEIGAEDAQKYAKLLKKRGRSAATINRCLVSLRGFYRYAVEKKLAPLNPFANVTMEKPVKKLPESLDSEEIELLFQAPDVKDPKGCRDKAMLELLYATGVKVSELTALDLEDVNLRAGILRCRTPKAERVIPIYQDALDVLTDYIYRIRPLLSTQQSEALFINFSGQRLTRQGFWKIIKQYAARTGIRKDITPHTLRHSFAIHLLENGAGVRDIQEMLGHADVASTQVYVQLVKNRMQEVYQKCHPKA